MQRLSCLLDNQVDRAKPFIEDLSFFGRHPADILCLASLVVEAKVFGRTLVYLTQLNDRFHLQVFSSWLFLRGATFISTQATERGLSLCIPGAFECKRVMRFLDMTSAIQHSSLTCSLECNGAILCNCENHGTTVSTVSMKICFFVPNSTSLNTSPSLE